MSRDDVRRWVHENARDPVFWTEVIQIVKTVVAGVISWVLATHVLDLQQSFLAPWAAILVVHATVYRTFSQGARQVGATVVGVLVAWVVGNLLGLSPLAVGVALLAGLAIGALPWFEGQGTTAAATALVVLTTGFSTNDNVLVSRLVDTAVGVVVGLLVNLVVWPPLRRRTAIRALDALDDRIGRHLTAMGEGLVRDLDDEAIDDWVDEIRDLDAELDQTWALVRQARESARLNPRRQAKEFRDPRQWTTLLHDLEQAIAESLSICHTVRLATQQGQPWHDEFRDAYAQVLCAGGHAIEDADRDGLRRCRDDLDQVIEIGARSDPDPYLWPVYGALVVNLRNILDAMDEVAGANPLHQPPLPFRGRGAAAS
ncbi:FUSC family protein [Nocardioides sp. KIGAM211]|uniref:FUSC family protein n=1 Tax=Nocardioides luti TaxID=2761101 RepID=A0A7X0RJ66_9ACTN|nr:FUSC family protein [Nocardioides luti]